MNNGASDAPSYLQTWFNPIFPSHGTYSEMVSLPNAKVVGTLGINIAISPVDNRHIMQMLNLKVLISLDGGVKLEGWFTPESDGLSSTTSSRYRRKALRFSVDLRLGLSPKPT
jgi:hypothetical protein